MVKENGTPRNMGKGSANIGRNYTLVWMRVVGSWLLRSPMDTKMIRLRCLTLLAQVDREIDRFVGDGIYDQEAVYEAVDHHSPRAGLSV